MVPRACPVCGKPVQGDLRSSPTYPFCSDRCRLVDLGNWLSDRYRISEPIAESEGVEGNEENEEV